MNEQKRAAITPKASEEWLRQTVEVTFDATLWNAVPQEIKNRYGHCTGDWFQQTKTGALIFVAQVPKSDLRGFIRDIQAFAEKQRGAS